MLKTKLKVEVYTEMFTGRFIFGIYKVCHPYLRASNVIHRNWLAVKNDSLILKEPKIMLFLLLLKFYKVEYNIYSSSIQKLIDKIC